VTGDERWIEWVDRRAVDVVEPTSNYVELYWLPTVGPSCVWLYRRLVAWLNAAGDRTGLTIDIVETGRLIGLHGAGGKNSPVARAVTRCGQFGLLDDRGFQLGVRLPEVLRSSHPPVTVHPLTSVT
jgi:hypothetical protein